jgi:hypothetical protein
MATIFMKSGGLATALSNRELAGNWKNAAHSAPDLISGRVTTQLIRRRLTVIFGWPATPRNCKQLPSNLVANRDGVTVWPVLARKQNPSFPSLTSGAPRKTWVFSLIERN